MSEQTKFRDLSIGDTFDFVSPESRFNSFLLACEKISPRKYRDEDGTEHKVGTINCNVYNVEKKKEN